MIIVHAYCSYKSSPVGFSYGTFEYLDNSDPDFYKLKDEYRNSFVMSSFEDGKVKRICGKIPEKDEYIFLFRKFHHDYGTGHEEFGRDVDMNMAFGFDNFEEFIAFKTNFEKQEKSEPDKLKQMLADCIKPDRSIDNYKLCFNKKSFDNLVKEMLSIPSDKSGDRLKKQVIITASTSSSDCTKHFINQYDLAATDENNNPVTLKRTDNTAEYVYPVKKNKLHLNQNPQFNQKIKLKKLLKMVLTSLCILLIALIVIVMMKNKNSNAAYNNHNDETSYTVQYDDIFSNETIYSF